MPHCFRQSYLILIINVTNSGVFGLTIYFKRLSNVCLILLHKSVGQILSGRKCQRIQVNMLHFCKVANILGICNLSTDVSYFVLTLMLQTTSAACCFVYVITLSMQLIDTIKRSSKIAFGQSLNTLEISVYMQCFANL